MSSATSPWEERERRISRSPSSAACPGATFAKGVSFSWNLPPHRLPTACWPGPVRTHAVLAPSLLAAQWDQCKSPPAALHLRSAGRADEPGSNSRKQNKRKKKKDKG